MNVNFGHQSVRNEIDNNEITKRQIIKNILLMSFVFLLNFIAFGGLSGLQSSLHLDEGMGTTTQSVLYAAMVISSLLLPKLATQKFGHKWCVTFSLISYMTWMAANGYAIWATMIPTSILVGISASILWTSQCSYFTILANEYSKIVGQNKEGVIALFFGIFYMILQFYGIIGSIISSIVLKQTPPENYTGPSEEELALCGINDCPDNNVTNVNLVKPDQSLVRILVGIYIAIAVAGFVCSILFIDQIPAYLIEKPEEHTRDTLTDGLKATVCHMKDPSQLLLIPLTIFVGLGKTFATADWNKSFVTCNLGIWMIGYVTLPFAIVNAATSFAGGRLVKITGRIPIFIAGMCLQLLLICAYTFWSPDLDGEYMFYVIAGAGGMAEGIWRTQIKALYGAIFTKSPEAAFSNYCIWESVGFFMAFGYSSHLCTMTKISILLSFLIVGMILYAIVECISTITMRRQHVIELTEENENFKL